MTMKKMEKHKDEVVQFSKQDFGKRINKYLSNRYFCSRREAEELVLKGWVKVNGKTLRELSYLAQKEDEVCLNKKALIFLKKKQTIFINKPRGYVSGQAERKHKPAITLVVAKNFAAPGPCPKIQHKGFAPAGRLDEDSNGLLILTQNGFLAKKIIGPHSDVEKEYRVKVSGPLTPEKIKKLCFGLHLDGKKLKKAQVTQISKNELRFILKEGKKRQIRRMCHLVNLQVISLERIRIGSLKLGSLPSGCWQLLENHQINDLF